MLQGLENSVQARSQKRSEGNDSGNHSREAMLDLNVIDRRNHSACISLKETS